MIDDKNFVAEPTAPESSAEQKQTETRAVLYTPGLSTDTDADTKVNSDSIEVDQEVEKKSEASLTRQSFMPPALPKRRPPQNKKQNVEQAEEKNDQLEDNQAPSKLNLTSGNTDVQWHFTSAVIGFSVLAAVALVASIIFFPPLAIAATIGLTVGYSWAMGISVGSGALSCASGLTSLFLLFKSKPSSSESEQPLEISTPDNNGLQEVTEGEQQLEISEPEYKGFQESTI